MKVQPARKMLSKIIDVILNILSLIPPPLLFYQEINYNTINKFSQGFYGGPIGAKMLYKDSFFS
jgi:hypothetical protein